MRFHFWETDTTFNEAVAQHICSPAENAIKWVDWKGKPARISQGVAVNPTHIQQIVQGEIVRDPEIHHL